ncbi:MAG: hypothetical protein WB822_20155, partial [Rhodoplanes sp.]
QRARRGSRSPAIVGCRQMHWRQMRAGKSFAKDAVMTPCARSSTTRHRISAAVVPRAVMAP